MRRALEQHFFFFYSSVFILVKFINSCVCTQMFEVWFAPIFLGILSNGGGCCD